MKKQWLLIASILYLFGGCAVDVAWEPVGDNSYFIEASGCRNSTDAMEELEPRAVQLCGGNSYGLSQIRMNVGCSASAIVKCYPKPTNKTGR